MPRKPRDWRVVNLYFIRLKGRLRADLAARVHIPTTRAVSLVANRDLTRYYDLMHSSLRRLDLPEAEATWLLSIIGSTEATPAPPAGFYHYVERRCRAGIDADSGVDADTLLAKLRPLSHLDVWAILDACEQWWILRPEDNRTGLIAVGLLAPDVLACD